jgi:hypothetical protein
MDPSLKACVFVENNSGEIWMLSIPRRDLQPGIWDEGRGKPTAGGTRAPVNMFSCL